MDTKRPRSQRWWIAVGIAVALMGLTSSADGLNAQSRESTLGLPIPPPTEQKDKPGKLEVLPAPIETGVVAASCATCTRGVLGGPRQCNLSPDGGPPCVPGRFNDCSCCNSDSPFGRLFCRIYESICCPDPCFEPCWIPQANSALFVDPVRPVTQMRIRWDAGVGLTQPDRAEYFWGRIGVKGPPARERRVKYHDLLLYNEVASGKASFFTEIPYRSLDPEVNKHAAGFSDFNVGTKALLVDGDLLQLAFQFRTYLPVGNFNKGLGTGHVSLEPSLLAALKLTPDTYLQTQLSELIPIGADQHYAGAILHYHFALNHVLFRIAPDVPFIGSLELNGYSFQDGAYTDPVAGPFQAAGGDAFINIGPGFRLVICDKIDIAFGAVFSLTNNGGPEQLYRTEFRWRF